MHETLFPTTCRVQFTVNFHIHRPIVFRVAENIAQNNSFEKYKVTPASKVSPFDGKLFSHFAKLSEIHPSSFILL